MEQSRIKIGKYPSFIDMLAIMGMFVLSSVLCGIAASILTKALSSPETESVNMDLSMMLAYTSSFVITIAFALILRQKRTNTETGDKILFESLKNLSTPAAMLWGLILVIATSIVIEPIVILFPESIINVQKLMYGSGWMTTLTAVVIAPFMEELLFRGIIQTDLTRKYGPIVGIIFSSLIFGVVHIEVAQAINAFFVGVILGYIYYTTRSLWAVVLIHAVNNMLSLFLSSIYPDPEKIISISNIITINWLYYTIYFSSCTLFIWAVVKLIKIHRDTKNKQQAENA